MGPNHSICSARVNLCNIFLKTEIYFKNKLNIAGSDIFWQCEKYPFQQSRRIHINSASALYDMNGSVFTLALVDSVTVHKYRDEGTRWESSVIGL